MQFYRFMAPSTWSGSRDIDEEIDLEKIKQDLMAFDQDEEGETGDGMMNASPLVKGGEEKSKTGGDKKSKKSKGSDDQDASKKNKWVQIKLL